MGHDPRPDIHDDIDPQVSGDLDRQGVLPADLVGEAGGRDDRLLERDAGLGTDEFRLEVRACQGDDPAAEGCDRGLVGRPVRQRDVEGGKLADRVNDEHLLLRGEVPKNVRRETLAAAAMSSTVVPA